MNLLQKNTQHLLKVLPFVFLFCIFLFYVLLKIQTTHLQEVQLLLKQENVLNKFNTGHLDSTQNIVGEYEISINKPINEQALKVPTDTLIYYPSRKEYVPFQMRTTLVERHGKRYQLTTFVSSVEIAHLIVAVILVQLVIFAILLFAIIKINKRLSSALWKPFYNSLNTLEAYDISTSKSVQLDKSTGISEFNELNESIIKLTERNQQAYSSQKEFVENAAHEMQTPLAIIRSKIELMAEQADLKEQGADLLLDISTANNRLVKLNKTLSLLSKIENNQYTETCAVNISDLTRSLLTQLKSHQVDNFPDVRLDIADEVLLISNPTLIEILISNLLRNALIHNIPSGYISISLNNRQLFIENSGKDLSINPDLLFERFRVGDKDSKKSTGLGLAIVKKICDLNGFKVSYSYEEQTHTLKIDFNEQ